MFHRDNDVRYGLPLKLTLALAALVIIIGGMRFAASLLVPLLLAIFVAVVCTAPIQWLHRMGLGLRTSVWLILGLIGGFLSLIGLLLVNSFSTFVEADRKSTRLNSSHVRISYAVFCLKKKKNNM